MAGAPIRPAPETARREAELRAWAEEYGPALRRYFEKRAGAADADDLVQDVFLRLQGRGESSQIENVEGYLFRTAANVLGMRRRRSTWAWGRQEDVEEIGGLSDELSPERILIGREALDTMMAALRELPPRCAHAFILYRFEHLPQEAVAERMGISVKAVEALVQRAARRLFDRVGWRP